jgi:hypothetical protein
MGAARPSLGELRSKGAGCVRGLRHREPWLEPRDAVGIESLFATAEPIESAVSNGNSKPSPATLPFPRLCFGFQSGGAREWPACLLVYFRIPNPSMSFRYRVASFSFR